VDRKAFSLVELLVVLGLLLLLAGLAYGNYAPAYRLAAATAALRGFLEEARTEALRREALVEVRLSGGRLVAEGGGWSRSLSLADLGVQVEAPPPFRFNALGRLYEEEARDFLLRAGSRARTLRLHPGGRVEEVGRAP